MNLALERQANAPLMPLQEMAWFGAAQTDQISVGRPLISPETTVSMPAWLDQVGKGIGKICELGRNWDGRGSAAVRRDVLSFALQMLWQTMLPNTAAPSLVPLGNGGVQLLWSNELAELTVEVIQPNDIYIYCIDRTTELETEWQSATEFSELASLLKSKFS